MTDPLALARLALGGGALAAAEGEWHGHPTGAPPAAPLPAPAPAGGSHTNPVFRLGEVAVLKLYARTFEGPHPEVEIGRHLTERVGFTGAPALLGWLTLGGRAAGVLHACVPGARSAWDLAREAFPTPAAAGRLGAVTAALHRALRDDRGDPAFRTGPLGPEYVAAFRRAAAALCDRVLPALPEVPGAEVRRRLLGFAAPPDGAVLQRVHGDLHLDQVLLGPGGPAVIDFEGEPDRPLSERRARHPVEKDLAGMLRSFSYAAGAAGAPAAAGEEVEQAFLAGYVEAGGAEPGPLLPLYLLEKAVYEAGYELSHRPAWLPIPVRGILRLLR